MSVEDDRGEHLLGDRPARRAGDEVVQLAQDRLGVAGEEDVGRPDRDRPSGRCSIWSARYWFHAKGVMRSVLPAHDQRGHTIERERGTHVEVLPRVKQVTHAGSG
jgi:hypothetical protein